MNEGSTTPEVDRFVLGFIDSVPHLEALLILWRTRPRVWTIAELAKALYLQARQTEAIAGDLTRDGFLVASSEGVQYAADAAEQDRLISAVDQTYRRETVRLSTMLHARGSRALRDFAQSFQLKRKKD
ncbi:MAG: hypothetical protein AB1762_01450 [Gemmatimonadota bacterium]